MGSKGKYGIYAGKFSHYDNDYLEIEGELVALDFVSAISPRVVNIKCQRLKERKICAWSEFGVLSGKFGSIETHIIQDEDIAMWDNDGNVRIVTAYSKAVRTVEINMKNKSLIETYNFTNGDIRTVRLVDSFEEASVIRKNADGMF